MTSALALLLLLAAPDQSLFDGKTLAGWHISAKPADRAKTFWSVRDGAITCDSLGRKDHAYVWLVSDEEFDDFELTLQVKGFANSPGNSGVQFRSRYDETLGWLHGPQADIHPPAPFRSGLIYDETHETRRWIFPSLPDWKITPEQGPKDWKWNSDGWNDIVIRAKGLRVTTIVNGITITDQDFTGILDDAAHRSHNVGRRGHFALQLHDRDELLIQYRGLRVGPLRQGTGNRE